MPLPSPRLDDRTFEQLTADAAQFIARNCPAWTDRSPHDPGMVLLEAFAYLTEVLLYRVNRLPEKAYVEFLRLLGVRISPPSAARTMLSFSLAAPAAAPVVIPRGTRVAARTSGPSGAPPTFTTADEATIAQGQREAAVLAFHCDVVEGEPVGTGTGLPGQTFAVKRAPLVAPTGHPLDLVVAVEATPDELPPEVESVRIGDKAYRVWREVSRFVHARDEDGHVYVSDRQAGTISFAPAVSLMDPAGNLEPTQSAHAEVPAPGREIRVSYRRGGGPEGNVGAHEISSLKEPVRGAPPLTVENREAAMGGRAAESVANAVLRGPEEIHSLRRAVTASDFEILARRMGGVSRARALAQADLWAHGRPGTVEVLLVPELPADVRGADDAGVNADTLREHQSEATRAAIQADLDGRQAVGTRTDVKWTQYKKVSVKTTVRAHPAADRAAVKDRVRARLTRYIDPLPRPDDQSPGWRFGAPLATGSVYHEILSEPGVALVESLSFRLDEVPAAAAVVAADAHQRNTWYVGNGEVLYRSTTDGDGWEAIGRFPGESIDAVLAHPTQPGVLAVAARLSGPAGNPATSRIHRSLDCGETWLPREQSLHLATDLAWIVRGEDPLLLIATEQGLYELGLDDAAQPLPVEVDAASPNLPLYAVASAEERGTWTVAVATQDRKGVYVSERGGGFKNKGLEKQDVRRLELQQDGPRTRLWAGLFADPDEPGRGAWMLELTSAGGWREISQGWDGGALLALTFAGSSVFAASHHWGILVVDPTRENPQWSRPKLGCGLPERSEDQLFQPVVSAAARGGDDPQSHLLLAGTSQGVFRRKPDGTYQNSSAAEVTGEQLSLPSSWLFCSGAHEIQVVGT
jgi:hypothetical protein